MNMKTGTMKKLALGASCALLLSTTALTATAQDNMNNAWSPSAAQAATGAPVSTAPAAAPAPAVAAPGTVSSAPAPSAMVPADATVQPWTGGTRASWEAAKPADAAPAPVQDPAAFVGPKTTLQEAVGSGVKTNPEYGVVANNRRATDEELNQAKSLYRPSIDARADTGYEHTDDPGTRTPVAGRSDEENLWRYNAGLTLTQMLFDGWNTRYENLRQQARVLSAANRVREASELIGLSVVEAYLEVMRQREILKIARQNVAQHMSILEQIQDSSQVGRSTQADSEQARARLASARAEEASIREALRTAEASYIREVGAVPQNLVMPTVPHERLAGDVESEVKQSLENNPTISISEADVKVANAEYKGSKATFYPKFDLQLNGNQGDNLGGVEGRDTSASALVVMNWNLYRGGGDTARVREFMSREAQAKESRAKTAREVESDVRSTWARMTAAGERASQFATQADANTEVVRAYLDQFDLNRRTLLDVLDSQNELFVSRTNAVNAEFLEMFAVYRLLALKGELLKTLQVDYPREADPAKM